MLASVPIELPFRPMLLQAPLQIVRLEGFFAESSLEMHRHDFHMLCWVTKGFGVHRIGYREFDWVPGRVFFLQAGQTHQVLQYPRDGWMVLFSEMVFRHFIEQNPGHEGLGLLDFFNPMPFVEVDDVMLRNFNLITGNLMSDGENSLPVLQYYLSVLLLYAAGEYRASHQLNFNLQEAGLMRKLKSLIECHYLTSREPAFYGKCLGIASRRLNEICRSAMGKGVYELVTERLLSECESLLAAQTKPVKTICFEMGFTDPANFTTFFKKHRGMSPVEFRAMIGGGPRS